MGWALESRGEYPADWERIAREIKEAAGWRCIRCGHPDPVNYSPRGYHPCDEQCRHALTFASYGPGDDVPKPLKRILTVHHLDANKANCRWWNLLALCQVCHLQVQAKLDPRVTWLFEHSRWFKVYVGGFYAFWFESRDVKREDVERDLDAYLRIGQPWLYGEEM